MSNQLWLINDWEERAHAARYCVKELARQCDVPVRTLRRFLSEKFGVSLSRWLRDLRMQRAAELLADGKRVNETADEVGYGDTCQFSRAFKTYHGHAPGGHFKRPPRDS